MGIIIIGVAAMLAVCIILALIEAFGVKSNMHWPLNLHHHDNFSISELSIVNLCWKYAPPSVYMMHCNEVATFVKACVARHKTGDMQNLVIITEGKLSVAPKTYWWSSKALQYNDHRAAKINVISGYKTHFNPMEKH